MISDRQKGMDYGPGIGGPMQERTRKQKTKASGSQKKMNPKGLQKQGLDDQDVNVHTTNGNSYMWICIFIF